MKYYYFINALLLLIVKALSQDLTKCQAVTEKYSNCVSSFHADSFETKCETFSSTLCQQLFKSPETILKDCDEEFIEITSAVLKDMNNILQYTCYKDEEGEYCPLSKIIQDTEIHPDIYEKQKFSEIFENIKESCSSEKCLKISISYMESIKSMLNDDQSEEKDDIDTLISFLNTCPKDNSNNNSENNNNPENNNNNKSSKDTNIGNNVKNNNNGNGNSNSGVNKGKNEPNNKDNNSSKVINTNNNSNSVNGNSKTSNHVNSNNSNSENENDLSSYSKSNNIFDPSNISEVLSNNDESDSTVLITALDHNQNDQSGSLNDGDIITNNAVDPSSTLNNNEYINYDSDIKNSLDNTTYNNTISENNINVVPDQSGSPSRIVLSYSFLIIILSLIFYI